MMAMSIGVEASTVSLDSASDVPLIEVRCGHYLRRGSQLIAVDSRVLLGGVWLKWRLCLRREETTKERSSSAFMVLFEIEFRESFPRGNTTVGLM